jgi:hypothetical protein
MKLLVCDLISNLTAQNAAAGQNNVFHRVYPLYVISFRFALHGEVFGNY